MHISNSATAVAELEIVSPVAISALAWYGNKLTFHAILLLCFFSIKTCTAKIHICSNLYKACYATVNSVVKKTRVFFTIGSYSSEKIKYHIKNSK